MGEKINSRKKGMRVVLDTNVVISSLYFGAELERFKDLWRAKRIVLLLTPELSLEYLKTLAYPKFAKTDESVALQFQTGILPFAELVAAHPVALPHSPTDSDDEKLLRAAIGGRAQALVSGDKALQILNGKYPFPILRPSDFLKRYFPA
jgi:putative PIN family toxin of toxin-antitoxin system